MITLTHCPLCAGEKFEPFLTCKDYTVSKESFNIVVCSKCTFKFTNPRPDQKEIWSYYESEDYISHTDTDKGLISKLYKIVRNYTVKTKVGEVGRYVKKGRILDFGAGTGFFLNACKQAGWQVDGIEPGEAARKVAFEKHGITLSDETALSHYNEEQFDVITLWHVLEHVDQLHDQIAQFRRILKKNGLLLIAVPNHISLDAEMYKETWAAYDVPRHLSHFSPITMRLLMAKNEMNVWKKKPMWFDAIYVCMLSEQYKTGKSNMIKAVLNGFRSNLYASVNKNSFSSLIYFIQKNEQW